MTVSRIDKFAEEALSTHREGEIILSGKTSLGFTGFENQDGITALSFGFPYREAPKSYIRKLTLAPAVEAFQFLKKGETVLLTWEIQENRLMIILILYAMHGNIVMTLMDLNLWRLLIP